jgi:hypothetical protein
MASAGRRFATAVIVATHEDDWPKAAFRGSMLEEC